MGSGKGRLVLAAMVLGMLSVATLAIAQEAPQGAEPWLPREALTTLRHLAIQDGGRNKPFDSFARETLSRITGQVQLGDAEAVETVVSILVEPELWQGAPLVDVPFIPLRQKLGMDDTATHISYNALIETRKLMRMLPAIVKKQQRDQALTMLENETMDVYDRFVRLNGLFEQRLHLVPSVSRRDPVWRPILQPDGYPSDQQDALRQAWQAFVIAARTHEPQAVTSAVHTLAGLLRSANVAAYLSDWRARLEVFYNRIRPFYIAQMAYLLAALGLGFGLITRRGFATRLGLGALWAGFLVHAGGIILRVVLGERPPVSNFYETMVWIPWVAVTLALMFDRIYRVRFFGLSASILAAIMLPLADILPLNPSISPVVAVLRSNLWLTIHVLTIVASYGAIALATVLAHIYAGLYVVRGGRHAALDSLEIFTYRATQVGVVLLTGGIMLGAVWANASWGRYWAWDPKETWALITLMWYLAVLHGRFAGWLSGVGIALATIGGFFLLLVTYYGVSFYMVGLHSYAGGNAKPLPPTLIAYLVGEAAFMGVVGLRALTARRAA